jgi:transcriptional regulator with XRE-family HTH domain
MAPETIKDLRRRLGLTQESLAALIGVDHATYWRWEQGRTRPLPVFARELERLDRETPSPDPA